jgi:DNA-binding CsgD family transcriptional regulator
LLGLTTANLTEREGEIAGLLLRGHSAKSIARDLRISPGTVRNHMKRIYAKLGVSSQSELFAAFLDALAQSEGDGAGAPTPQVLDNARS